MFLINNKNNVIISEGDSERKTATKFSRDANKTVTAM